ncbi:MAG: LysM peptidoglycan-binding domain-containing protein [Gemmatimonadales bacterium]|nr:LysM peptidoglycan-binding domain-containing protein [Gemmatimonadales bacterium]
MTISRSSLSRALGLALPFAAGMAVAVPAQGAKASSHTVRKGDTLWEIARAYLGDPFLWPQIYKLNTEVVKDPHWIYPGELLKLEGAPGQTAVPTTDTPPPAPAAIPAPRSEVTPSAPAPAPAPSPMPMAERAQGGQGQQPDDGLGLFRRLRVTSLDESYATYREVKYHPLRQGEFHSAGFLTEGEALPFGTLLGPVTPEQIQSGRSRAAMQIYTAVGMAPPDGASYAKGDLLLVVNRREGPVGYGEIVIPTGLVRVTGQNGSQAVGEVIALYGSMRDGQSVMPAEKFTDPGAADWRKVENGVEGHVLAPRDGRELRRPQEILFLDIGKAAGLSMGDLLTIIRTPGPQDKSAANAVAEEMATVQVVHLRDKTATVKVVTVASPDIRPGTRVKQVAKLPN